MSDAPEIPPITDLVVDEAPFDDDQLDEWLSLLASVADDTSVSITETGIEANAAVARWAVTGTRSAEWAMGKLRDAEATINTVSGQADELRAPLLEQLNRIDEWAESETRRPKRTADFFRGHLERWALANRTDKVKTMKVPSGEVSTRATPPSFEIADMDTAVTYARAHSAKVTEKVTVTALKDAKAVEIVEHLVWMPDPDSGEKTLVRDATVAFVRKHSDYDIEFNDADPDEGVYVAFDADGAALLDAAIEHGPFVVEPATGLPVEGLVVKPGEVHATVKLAR